MKLFCTNASKTPNFCVFPPTAPEVVKENSIYLHQMHVIWNQGMILENLSTTEISLYNFSFKVSHLNIIPILKQNTIHGVKIK
jgi:hypothetical protein